MGEVIQISMMKMMEFGVLGVAVVILVIALVRKDKQVNSLYVRLVEKSERDSDKYHDLAAAQSDAVKELAGEIKEMRYARGQER